MDRREFLVALSALAASIAASRGSAQAASTVYPPEYEAIIEASKAEGPMTIYSNWGDEFWPEVLAPFKAKYPWIQAVGLDLGGNEVLQRYLLEKSAGSKTADLIVPTFLHVAAELFQRGEIVDYKSPEAENLPDFAKPNPGVYGILADAEVFAWNKQLLPANLIPTSFQDLANKVKANPEVFQGKIVCYPAHEEAYRNLVMRRILEKNGEKFWEWMDIIGPNARFEMNAGGMFEKIMSGEFLVGMAVPLSPCIKTVQNPARASLFGWGFIGDGTVVGPRQAGIPVGGTNVNSARLLLDFMLSVEGQVAISKTNKMPIRSDLPADSLPADAVTVKSIVEAVGAENVLQLGYDPKAEGENAAFVERYKKAFNVQS
jgi:iron(III) transport system substrate-binding protein